MSKVNKANFMLQRGMAKAKFFIRNGLNSDIRFLMTTLFQY